MSLQTNQFKRYKRHKISKCYFCGWTNNTIRPLRVKDGNLLLTVSACKLCIDKHENKVSCIRCGLKNGKDIIYRTIIRKRLNNETTMCCVILPLCQDCVDRWIKIKEEDLHIPVEVCDSCEERFTCYTGKNTNKWNRHIPPKVLRRKRKKFGIV